jgi:hypothetical protein
VNMQTTCSLPRRPPREGGGLTSTCSKLVPCRRLLVFAVTLARVSGEPGTTTVARVLAPLDASTSGSLVFCSRGVPHGELSVCVPITAFHNRVLLRC